MDYKLDPIFSIFSLLRCANGLTRQRARFYGLNDLETITLIHIGLMENPTQKDICDKLRSPKQTINNIIKNLEEEGFVRLIQSDKDKRSRILTLTEAGSKNMDEKLKPITAANKKMYEKLGDDKVKQIRDALSILIGSIKDDFIKED